MRKLVASFRSYYTVLSSYYAEVNYCTPDLLMINGPQRDNCGPFNTNADH